MKLSVIIPVHNADKYLSVCLDSVLTQDIQDLEVICVDDASTDSSAAIIREYQQKDSRIRLFQNASTMFAGTCRNTGLQSAQGEYVHFLDSDDIVEEGAYLRLYKLAKDADADFLKCRSNCFDNDTGEISTTPLLDLSDVPEDFFGKILTFSQAPEIFSHISVVPWHGIYKRTFLLQNKIEFNHLVCVNVRSFFNEISLAAGRILLTQEHLVQYRINNGQSLMGNRARNFQCQFESFSIVKKQCEKYGITGRELALVLERELVDLFIWYRRYRNLPEIQESIISRTRDFSRSLDVAPLENYPPDFKWYYDYLLLTRPRILTVAVHLTGDVSKLSACLESIQKQSVEQFYVYGICKEKSTDSTQIFQEFADKDPRFRQIVSAPDDIPRETLYFFETYPKEYTKENDFKNRIKKIMAESTDLTTPQTRMIYEPAADTSGIFRKVLNKLRKR